MGLTEEDLKEFRQQGEDFLAVIAVSLAGLERKDAVAVHFDPIFRAFHGLKGSASMLGMDELKAHMIALEAKLQLHKRDATFDAATLEFFKNGLETARVLLGGPIRALALDPGPDTLTPEGRVLVIDDEPDLVELITQILIASNMDVHGTSQPERVAELIESFKPDAIITDIAMPRMSGMDVLNLVHKSQPDLPVVFVSGHVDKDSLLAAIDLGVFAVIEKPFDVVKVVATSRNAVRRHKLHKLLNRSINLIAYNFSEIDGVLAAQGKDDLRRAISHELDVLLDGRRHLRSRATAEG